MPDDAPVTQTVLFQIVGVMVSSDFGQRGVGMWECIGFLHRLPA